MKSLRIITICLAIAALSATGASAGKQSLGGYGYVGNSGGQMSESEQFAQKYTDAKASGDKAFNDFAKDVARSGDKNQTEMFDNMNNGKTPQGKALPKDKDGNPQGFGGDPNDPGPSDWSDHNIKTDGKGNVIGFEEKDFEKKDVDGDGEISDDERKEWDEKKKKEHEENGGAPGEVPPIAEWDKDGNGKPDKGFERSCWQCCPGEEKLNECHYGFMGSCDNGGSCDISEICHQANEVHDDVEYECHTCEYMNDWPDPCTVYGLYSSASCNSACNPIDACYAVYIDQSDGTRRTSTVMRTDLVCYECGSFVQPPPKCEDGLLDGVCQGDDCEMYDTCRTVGDYCHICEDPTVECKDGYAEGICSDTTCSSNQKCVQSGKCYACEDIEDVEDECEDGLSEGACPGDCHGDEICVPAGDNCHSCKNPEEIEDEKCEFAELYGGGCPGVCDEDQNCFERKVDGAQCHDCVLKECSEYDMFSDCGACSEAEICKPVGVDTIDCVECLEKLTCESYGFYESCDQCAIGFICESRIAYMTPGGGGKEEQIQCYECRQVSEEEEDNCEKAELYAGACPGICSEDEKCHGRLIDEVDCHECEPIEDEEEECEDGYSEGTCSDSSCQSNQKCVQDGDCYACEDKPEEEDSCEEAELYSGGCPGICSDDEKCHERSIDGAECHECVQQECYDFDAVDTIYDCDCDPKNCEEIPYVDLPPNVGPCYRCMETEECEHGYSPGACPGTCDIATEVCTPDQYGCHICEDKEEEKRRCIDNGYLTYEDCSGCISEGGKCERRRSDDYDTPCFECVDLPEEIVGCQSDAECDDGDMCTTDECMGGECVNTEIQCDSPQYCDSSTGECVGGEEEEECEHGYSPGGCPGSCHPETEVCTSDQYGCHICDDKEEEEEDKTCYYRQQQDGPCSSDACDSSSECEQFNYDGATCHWCKVKPLIDECPDHGKLGGCRGTCSSSQLCINQRGPCHICMDVESIEIEYIIIIVETPYGRYVLGKNDKNRFEPSSVMALAKVDPETGHVQSSTGEFKKLTDLMGGFNSGMGVFGMATTGSLSMPQLADVLGDSLGKGGSFGGDCFSDAVNEADKQAADSGMPTSNDIQGTTKERKKDKSKKDVEIFDEEQMRTADEAGDPAISGPIVSCGMEGRNKVLKVYDGAGRLVDTITKKMMKANPNILLEKIGLAQEGTDLAMNISGVDIGSYVEKFTGLPIKKMQSYASMVADYKAKADQAMKTAENLKSKKKKKKKKKKVEEEKPTFPNDPYYKAPAKKKKKKLLGILGGDGPKKVALGGAKIKRGSSSITERKEAEVDVKDQWGLHEIGFTDFTDPNSAWNVVDANEKNVVVAVVDSGLDMDHPDGPKYIWTNTKEIPGNGIDDDNNGFIDDIHGWNFLDENHNFTDIRGHGTFVAGIIAAKYNNGIGIAGNNPGQSLCRSW